MNITMERFGYDEYLLHDYKYWCVLLRKEQVTLGSAVLIEKSEATSLPEVNKDSFAELSTITSDYERTLKSLYPVKRFNYLALMMVDPNVHFHVIPRYEGLVVDFELDFADKTYPTPPNLGQINDISSQVKQLVRKKLRSNWAGTQSESSHDY